MGGGATALLVIATTYASQLVEHKSITAKPLIAGGVLGLMLSIVGGISPRVGNAFCVLVVVAAFVTNGADALKGLSNVTGAAGGTSVGGGNWKAPTSSTTGTPVSRAGSGIVNI